MYQNNPFVSRKKFVTLQSNRLLLTMVLLWRPNEEGKNECQGSLVVEGERVWWSLQQRWGGQWFIKTPGFLCTLAKARAEPVPLAEQGRSFTAQTLECHAAVQCNKASSSNSDLRTGAVQFHPCKSSCVTTTLRGISSRLPFSPSPKKKVIPKKPLHPKKIVPQKFFVSKISTTFEERRTKSILHPQNGTPCLDSKSLLAPTSTLRHRPTFRRVHATPGTSVLHPLRNMALNWPGMQKRRRLTYLSRKQW